MHVERGPYGQVIIKKIYNYDDIITYAYKRLERGDVCGLLPIYVRNHMNRLELCIDCTGKVALTEIEPEDFVLDRAGRQKIANFIRCILDIQNIYLDFKGLILRQKYIFIDIKTNDFFWSYCPLYSYLEETVSDDNWLEKFESLLLSDFFQNVFSEFYRLKLMEFIKFHEIAELENLLNAYVAEVDAPSQIKLSYSKLLIAVQCLAFLLTIFVTLIVVQRKGLNISYLSLRSGFIGVFLIMLIGNIAHLVKKKQQVHVKSQDINSESKQVYMRNLFPSSYKPLENKPCSHLNLLHPAYLEFFDAAALPSSISRGRAFILNNDFLIGRDSILCDLSLDSPTICDQHARILCREGNYFLRDLGSPSGLKINEKRLYTHEEAPLMSGDKIEIGNLQAIFTKT